MNIRIQRQQERREKVRKLWAKGVTVTQISERLGVVSWTIRSDLKEMGLLETAS